MQQYRLNYRLLIGLAIGAVIASAAVYGLWRFQIERKSGVLLAEAERARTKGNHRDESQFLSQYLSIHGSDNDTRLKLAEAYADLTEQSDATREDFGLALNVLEATSREVTDATPVQRRLVEIYGRIGSYQNALDHLGLMLEKEPNDPELQGLRADYLVRSGNVNDAVTYSYQLIGYDPKTDKFDEQKATTPHNVTVYSNLAHVLRNERDNPDLADRVIEQLTKQNPESPPALLASGSYWIEADEKDRGQEDIDKAYRLGPKDVDVLLKVAELAANDEQYAKASEYLAAGKKMYPDNADFYRASADLAYRQKDYEKAMAEIDAGLKAAGAEKSGLLLFYKADLQFQSNDLKGVASTALQMQKANFRQELIDWQDARVLVAEGKWMEASEALSRLRQRIGDFGDLPTQVDFFLGMCYERLGKWDLARGAYESALKANPKYEVAQDGWQRVMATLDPEKISESDSVPDELSKWMAMPIDQQDFAKIDRMIEQLASERGMDEFQTKLFQTQIALSRKDFAAARNLLREADKIKPDTRQVHLAAVTVARLDPKIGPAKASEMWDRVNKQFGDSAEMRLSKADLLVAINDEQMVPELASLLSGIDDWKPEQKITLWGGMARLYLSLGMYDEAKRYLSLVADERPNELPTRVSLFLLALETGDDDGMKAAQKKILEIVKDADDSTYLWSEARRRLSLVQRGQLEPAALADIRQIISRAIGQRPDWHELWLANADLELLANNYQAALAHYSKAEKTGRPAPRQVAQHIKLLVANGQFQEAGALLERIPESARLPLLEKYYTEILFQTNRVDDAIREAKAAIEADPENPQKQFWFGQLRARSAFVPEISEAEQKARAAESIAALRKAVELNPELPDAWFGLITLNGQQGNIEAAQQALRDAQLALAGDNLQIFLARAYESLGHWFDAETMYRSYYELDPKDVRRAQQLAAFYLGQRYPLTDRVQKAAPFVNQILRAAEVNGENGEKALAPNDPSLVWARRKAAEIFASQGDYQNSLNAEKLLASNSQDGLLSVEDRLMMAQILSRRLEPESRKKAISLLEEVSQVQALNELAEIVLGQLYFARGEWTKCRAQMLRAIGNYPKSAAARESYITMLLAQNDPRFYDEATRQFNTLRELAPNSRNTFAISVSLAQKLGKEDVVRADLLRRIPKVANPKDLTDQQAELLAFLANQFVLIKDLDNAERILQQLAQRDPKLRISVADFEGRYRDVGKSIEMLKQLYEPERVNDVLRVANGILRTRRDDVGDKYDGQVEQWYDRAKLENPDSITLQLLEADFFDLQKKYEQSAESYRKLLARPDLEGLSRAVVLNNLAYLLAITESTSSSDLDPLKLVQEAEQILGPSADILDTKAVVLIGRKRYKEAIDELELSVTDTPTGAKYFHMVVAHLGAGENREAIQAWNRAEAQGLTRDELNRLEHSRYDEVKAKIEQLRPRGNSVSQNEPVRRGG